MNRSTRIGNPSLEFQLARQFPLGRPYTIGTVTVTETGTSPAKTVADYQRNLGPIDVYAGITGTDRRWCSDEQLCIDPYQYFNSSAQPYTVASLASAPSPRGHGVDGRLDSSVTSGPENYQAALGTTPDPRRDCRSRFGKGCFQALGSRSYWHLASLITVPRHDRGCACRRPPMGLRRSVLSPFRTRTVSGLRRAMFPTPE